MATFSAALLAGGRSRRMGRDKALLPHPEGGLFWQRQFALLEELNPQEIFWSGFARTNLLPHARLIEDAAPDTGPLGGLVACLNALRSDLLVVLAVDLADMRAAYLQRLLSASKETCGAVGRHNGFYEPLAAVYPRKLRGLASTHLMQGQLALQDLVREAHGRGMMQVIDLRADEIAPLQNFNETSDLNQRSPHQD